MHDLGHSTKLNACGSLFVAQTVHANSHHKNSRKFILGYTTWNFNVYIYKHKQLHCVYLLY